MKPGKMDLLECDLQVARYTDESRKTWTMDPVCIHDAEVTSRNIHSNGTFNNSGLQNRFNPKTVINQIWEGSTQSSWPRPGKFTAGEYDYNLEAFAKNIVKECVNRIRAYDLVPGHSAKWEDIYEIHARLLDDLAEDLKEHFDIEKAKQ